MKQLKGVTVAEINVDNKDIIKAALEIITDYFDIPIDGYIEDGFLKHTVNYYTSHNWETSENYRLVKEEDKDLITAITVLKKYLQKTN